MAGFGGRPGTQNFTTTDAILGKGGRPCRVYGVYLLSTSTASVVILRNGQTVGGTIQLQLDGTISKATYWTDPNGLLFANGCFVDVDNNTSALAVSFEEEL